MAHGSTLPSSLKIGIRTDNTLRSACFSIVGTIATDVTHHKNYQAAALR